MASTRDIQEMGRRLPPGISDLATVVSKGPGFLVNVMGVVVDFREPSETRGTDWQMTFTICDTSVLSNGMRVKFFKKRPDLMPKIRQVGDVILLRTVKIQSFQNEISGLACWDTQFVVFPKDSIPSTAYRTQFGSEGGPLPYTQSEDASGPSLHEQQWAISLKDHFSLPDNALRVSSKSQTNGASVSSSTAPSVDPIAIMTTRASRDKYSLIKHVNPGSGAGNFYDLAGVVVKMFMNSHGYLDLYCSDYTSNKSLHDYKPNDSDERGVWHGPSGQMTLHIEVQQPHSGWTQSNINEGDFVLLKNVRVKWNRQVTGIEGNMWPDQFNPDKVCVSRLFDADPRRGEIQARMKLYNVSAGNSISSSSKSQARKAKKKRRRAEQKEHGSKRRGQDDERVTDNQSHDSSEEEDEADGPLCHIPAKKVVNTNVQCLHPDVPKSSFNDILHNPHRFICLPNGDSVEAPFNNVKHRVRLRIVDYYPHSLKDFAVSEPVGEAASQNAWNWCFWLIVVAGEPGDDTQEVINVLVEGADANELLQLHAADLSLKSNKPALEVLQETLFLLWGELAEKKDKFLAAHPGKNNEAFSTRTYNITTETLPFDGCVAEYGVPLGEGPASHEEGRPAVTKWMRVFRLFGTRIKR